MKKRLLSGIQPSGQAHIGNYFGAMKQYVDMQDEYDAFYAIVDYHALNTVKDGEMLKKLTLDMLLDFLAIGLDPKKCTIFKQSDVSEHTELAWIFETITTMPYLMRAHAFKDGEAKNKEISVGVFNYPLLMAADILLYDTDTVPVGADQKQHIEMSRNTAEKFNNLYGETFKLPKEFIVEEVSVIPGIDGQKMSKSYNNTIPLFASDEEIEIAVMKIPTDSKSVEESKNPDEVIIFNIHKLLLDKDEEKALRDKYESGGLGYKEAKELLITDLKNFIGPMRTRREELSKSTEDLLKILKEGGERAKKVASSKMSKVRKKIGVDLYS